MPASCDQHLSMDNDGLLARTASMLDIHSPRDHSALTI